MNNKSTACFSNIFTSPSNYSFFNKQDDIFDNNEVASTAVKEHHLADTLRRADLIKTLNTYGLR